MNMPTLARCHFCLISHWRAGPWQPLLWHCRASVRGRQGLRSTLHLIRCSCCPRFGAFIADTANVTPGRLKPLETFRITSFAKHCCVHTCQLMELLKALFGGFCPQQNVATRQIYPAPTSPTTRTCSQYTIKTKNIAVLHRAVLSFGSKGTSKLSSEGPCRRRKRNMQISRPLTILGLGKELADIYTSEK